MVHLLQDWKETKMFFDRWEESCELRGCVYWNHIVKIYFLQPCEGS